MKLSDIKTNLTFDIWFLPYDNSDSIQSGIGRLGVSDRYEGYTFINEDRLIHIRLRDDSKKDNLDFHLRRGCANLIEFVQIAKDGSAQGRIVFFNGNTLEMGNIDVGIDERIEETAKSNGLGNINLESLAEYLKEKTILNVGAQTFFVMIDSHAANDDFSSDMSATNTTTETSQFEDSDEDASQETRPVAKCESPQFSICGDRLRLPVEKRKLGTDDVFFATKVIFKSRYKEGTSLRLVRGKISYISIPTAIKALATGTMYRLASEAGSYLKVWDEYQAIEGKFLLEKAKKVGILRFVNAEITKHGVKFFLPASQNQLSILSVGDSIMITDEIPVYIKQETMTWNEYSDYLKDDKVEKPRSATEGAGSSIELSNTNTLIQSNGNNENNSEKEHANDNPKRTDERVDFFNIIAIGDGYIELADIPAVPSKEKFLVFSILGDTTQIERRNKARKLIIEGNSANPLLGLLIEDEGEIPEIQRTHNIEPLSHFVKTKIFKHDPTPKQVEAIRVALNTPDMALIQGPPGTGKTTVITAILERLNEIQDKTESIRGRVLVSGYQHDAVENIISRLSINSLPSVKFGSRSGSSEFSEDIVSGKIDNWCENVASLIRKKNPQLTQTSDKRDLLELIKQYLIMPSSNNAKNLLLRIQSIDPTLLTREVLENADSILELLEDESILPDPMLIRIAWSLPTTIAGLSDNGIVKLSDVLDEFKPILSEKEVLILNQAMQWKPGEKLNILSELKQIRKHLLDHCTPRPAFRVEKPREDILQLFELVSSLLGKTTTSEKKQDVILSEFLNELENNPLGVRQAMEDYNFVYAATTQQSVGSAIRRAKLENGEENIVYDTVIIDEAARTSPLDLLIPLCQASKRIILVGDHRQLPHLVDDIIAKELENSESMSEVGNVNDYIKESMFEHLFYRLKKLEAKDNIQRTVTLDAQYRTHPLLGEFASNQFYREFNEGYESPLPENLFANRLDGLSSKPALWIDVPCLKVSDGECKPSHSFLRVLEAEVIAQQLSQWIDSDEGKHFTYGIICFYKAQISEILKALTKYGITTRGPDGNLEITESYRFLKRNEDGKITTVERLRIGSVDAFQGMEFDVVFLSVVRSRKNIPTRQDCKNNDEYEKRKRMVFGHLMSVNRLCVSMSRQKRVLVVVGDARLIQSEIAKDSVPALTAFYELCKENGVIR